VKRMSERIHDHVEDMDDADGRTEAAYRRGCQQAIVLALRELAEQNVPIDRWPAFLEALGEVIGDMRFGRRYESLFLDRAIARTWRKLRWKPVAPRPEFWERPRKERQ